NGRASGQIEFRLLSIKGAQRAPTWEAARELHSLIAQGFAGVELKNDPEAQLDELRRAWSEVLREVLLGERYASYCKHTQGDNEQGSLDRGKPVRVEFEGWPMEADYSEAIQEKLSPLLFAKGPTGRAPPA